MSTLDAPEGMSSPEQAIPFEVVRVNEEGEELDDTFDPLYYPDRFNTKGGKDLTRNPKQCAGEVVDIKTLKNEEMHATGVMKSSTIERFRDVATHSGSVVLYTPFQPGGGIEAIIEKWEIGDIDGWDPIAWEWLVEWTLDFVGTGRDEHDTSSTNSEVDDIISEMEPVGYHDNVR